MGVESVPIGLSLFLPLSVARFFVLFFMR
jgi:hypothetical protein